MSEVLSYDGVGFSSPILAAHTKEYTTIEDPTRGDHIAKQAGGVYEPARSQLGKLLGFGTTRKIVPAEADGFCAYSASRVMNEFHGQVMGPRMVGLKADGQDWLQHDEIIADLSIEGKHNAGEGGKPIITIKLRICCDTVAPVCTVHLHISDGIGIMPITEPMSLQDAVRMVVTHVDPILVVYEFNHPQVGGVLEGRHFEALIPTPSFFKNLKKEAKKKDKKTRDLEQYLDMQAAEAEKLAAKKAKADKAKSGQGSSGEGSSTAIAAAQP
jgi:hypothetical protein